MGEKCKLVSCIAFVHGTDMGNFDSAAEAVEHALFCGLPGEEMKVVAANGRELMKITCPDSNLQAFLN